MPTDPAKDTPADARPSSERRDGESALDLLTIGLLVFFVSLLAIVAGLLALAMIYS